MFALCYLVYMAMIIAAAVAAATTTTTIAAVVVLLVVIILCRGISIVTISKIFPTAFYTQSRTLNLALVSTECR